MATRKCVLLHAEPLSVSKDSMAISPQVALLEDHPMLRTGLKLSLAPMYHVALEAGTAAEFFTKVQSTHIDVLVLDIILPDVSGVEVAKRLRSEKPEIKILVLSVDSREETFQQLVQIGVEGFLSKNAPEEKLQEAIRTILDGETYYSRPECILEREILLSAQPRKHELLTDREYDVMLAFCKGLSCNEIADQMCISPKTVDNHKQHCFAKLGIHNMVQLVTYAVRNKIIVLS